MQEMAIAVAWSLLALPLVQLKPNAHLLLLVGRSVTLESYLLVGLLLVLHRAAKASLLGVTPALNCMDVPLFESFGMPAEALFLNVTVGTWVFCRCSMIALDCIVLVSRTSMCATCGKFAPLVQLTQNPLLSGRCALSRLVYEVLLLRNDSMVGRPEQIRTLMRFVAVPMANEPLIVFSLTSGTLLLRLT